MQENRGTGIIIAGAQRSGKTFFTERLSEQKNRSRGLTVVYNPGMDTDWKDAEIITPFYEYNAPGINPKKKRELKDNFVCPRFFVHEKSGNLFKCEDIPKAFKGRTVKIYRQNDQFEESRLFKCFFTYFYGCLLVCDDFRPVTRHGLKSEMIELFSRQNHAGKSYCGNGSPGIDIAWIYHNLDGPPTEMYDYASHIVMFATPVPSQKDTGNYALNEARQYCYEKLLSMPRYSKAIIKIRDEPLPKIQLITP